MSKLVLVGSGRRSACAMDKCAPPSAHAYLYSFCLSDLYIFRSTFRSHSHFSEKLNALFERNLPVWSLICGYTGHLNNNTLGLYWDCTGHPSIIQSLPSWHITVLSCIQYSLIHLLLTKVRSTFCISRSYSRLGL